jgi:hypothetical protein
MVREIIKKHMRLIFAVVLMACPPLWGQDQSTSRATVEIQVMTFLGDRVDGYYLQLVEMGSKKDFSKYFTKHYGYSLATNLPYGEYLLDVSAGGLRPHHQLLKVFQPRVYTRVFLRLARFTDEETSVIEGYVTPTPPAKETLWVKILPLLSNESIGETQVQPDGSFLLRGLDNGKYILVVMRGTESLYLQEISLNGRCDLRISLSAILK